MKIVKIKRPWGGFERYCLNKQCTVKLLEINPHEELSLQSHKKRSEFCKIINGPAVVTLGKKKRIIKSGKNVFIKKGVKHRIGAKEKKVLYLEISFGKFDELDEVRYSDDYGRK
ncbi:MAG: cupin domain-containing protein [Candidatus Diapherotrites archaeon]|nr:cupin domain-containing protein [Candidatus Diapherotrites archaeon]